MSRDVASPSPFFKPSVFCPSLLVLIYTKSRVCPQQQTFWQQGGATPRTSASVTFVKSYEQMKHECEGKSIIIDNHDIPKIFFFIYIPHCQYDIHVHSNT